MPIRIECDGGCGETCDSEAEFTEFGHFEKKLYCAGCVKSVKEYYMSRDGIHDNLAKQWRAGLKRTVDHWRGEHEGGSLPDG